MCAALWVEQPEKERLRELSLILAYRMMPEDAKEMMLRVAQSYEKEPGANEESNKQVA